MLRSVRFAISAVLATLGSSARAQTEGVSIVYNGEPSCPTRSAFVAQVQARTRLAALADERAARWRFEIRIVRERGRFAGRLQMVERGGRPTERSVSGEDCNEVA